MMVKELPLQMVRNTLSLVKFYLLTNPVVIVGCSNVYYSMIDPMQGRQQVDQPLQIRVS